MANDSGLTADERQWLDDNISRITLLYNSDSYPVEFNSIDKGFSGLSAEIVSRIEKKLGVTFRKEYRGDWPSHLRALESGECALVPAIVRTKPREKFAFFTSPYVSIPVVIITHSGRSGRIEMDDLIGKKVVVGRGFAQEKFIRDDFAGKMEIYSVDSIDEGMRLVESGHADAYIEQLPYATSYITQHGTTNLRIAGSSGYYLDLRIGVSRKY
ncbi:MAG TPA: transporter substrate-binding domain-containing protein, partial [Spirochaetota bacterium]|nr:transporter substrate-binding domain-containing protein [Spirochaetota bacterium]